MILQLSHLVEDPGAIVFLLCMSQDFSKNLIKYFGSGCWKTCSSVTQICKIQEKQGDKRIWHLIVGVKKKKLVKYSGHISVSFLWHSQHPAQPHGWRKTTASSVEQGKLHFNMLTLLPSLHIHQLYTTEDSVFVSLVLLNHWFSL